MLVTSTIPTSFGRRLLTTRPMVRVALTWRELVTLIRTLNSDALEVQYAGRGTETDRLALRATILRDAVR